MSEQKKADDFGITEDDVSEIRQDINKFRFELVDILSRNNFDIGKVGGKWKFSRDILSSKWRIEGEDWRWLLWRKKSKTDGEKDNEGILKDRIIDIFLKIKVQKYSLA